MQRGRGGRRAECRDCRQVIASGQLQLAELSGPCRSPLMTMFLPIKRPPSDSRPQPTGPVGAALSLWPLLPLPTHLARPRQASEQRALQYANHCIGDGTFQPHFNDPQLPLALGGTRPGQAAEGTHF